METNTSEDDALCTEVGTEDDALYAEVGNFYFNTDSLHDVQFVVGEQQEIIKAVRLLLVNQSRVFWNMLCQDSPLAEKGDIHIPDIEPTIFKLLLRHSYGGLDSLDELSEDGVMKLCYCANKYMMKSLMKKIAAHIQPRDVDGLFIALHCLVYFNLKDVEDAVIKVIQSHTLKVLKHPKFKECDVDSVTYICKQEPLNCDEITVWKYVVEWAKSKAKCEEGPKLREWLEVPMKFVRFWTMCMADLLNHVFSLNILSGSEIADICKADSPCPKRYSANEETLNLVSVKISHRTYYNDHYENSQISSSTFTTKNKSIILQSLTFRSPPPYNGFEDYRDALLVNETEFNIQIQITKITDLFTNTSPEHPVVLELKRLKCYPFDRFTEPTLINNKGIPLEANNKYKIELTFPTLFPCWSKPDCVKGHAFDHGIFHCSEMYLNDKGITPCHIFEFTYKVEDD